MNTQQTAAGKTRAEVVVVDTYSRAQALEDGVLVDLTDWAREAGFRIPVAVTQAVWALLVPSRALEAEGEDVAGRAWDLFSVLRDAARLASGSDEIHFSPLFALKVGKKPERVELSAKCDPGFHGGPVITVMLKGEQ